MRIFNFRSHLRLERPITEVFEFFSNAVNLEELTPPWLQFQVISKLPIQMREGVEIEYRLRIRGIPVRWTSKITTWDPPHRFVDEQVHGPYRVWIHEHRFAEDSNGTLCDDYVQYAPLGGALVNRLFVEKDIQKIFAYRSKKLQQLFGRPDKTYSAKRIDQPPTRA